MIEIADGVPHDGIIYETDNDTSQEDYDAEDPTHYQISDASYRGSRTTPPTGGTWDPFDPSLDMIALELELGADYFIGSKCAEIDDDCTDLLNAVFTDGFAEQEPNQGTDPIDWRSDAIDMPEYLSSVYPNGSNWNGAFDYAFTP